MSEHPHQGLITAVAYLSDMYAKAYCADEALVEHGLTDTDPGRYADIRAALRAWADELMEPCGVANVLQTIEEVLAADGVPAGLAFKSPNENGRAEIVRWIVDGRQAALEDEREAEPIYGNRADIKCSPCLAKLDDAERDEREAEHA